MNLSHCQQLLWRLITAPEGVAKALAESPRDAALLESTVVGEALSAREGTRELGPERRLDVYAEAYFARIHDALQSDFSDLATQLGEESFHDLVTSYLAICPPRRPSLRDVGQRLPEFLARGVGGEPFRRRAAWAPDLARLECLQADLFDAPDSPIATRRDFESLPAEDWGQVRLRLVPAAALLALDWPVHRLCAAWPGGGAGAGQPEAIAPEPTELLVWRAFETVSYRPLEPGEAHALARVASGTSFGEVCEATSDRINQTGGIGEQEAPSQNASWLARWLEDGVLAAIAQPA